MHVSSAMSFKSRIRLAPLIPASDRGSRSLSLSGVVLLTLDLKRTGHRLKRSDKALEPWAVVPASTQVPAELWRDAPLMDGHATWRSDVTAGGPSSLESRGWGQWGNRRNYHSRVCVFLRGRWRQGYCYGQQAAGLKYLSRKCKHMICDKLVVRIAEQI